MPQICLKQIPLFLLILTAGGKPNLLAQQGNPSPRKPTVEWVSIDTAETQESRIRWLPSPDTDVEFYRIYELIIDEFDQPQSQLVGTVSGDTREFTYARDPSRQPPFSYRVAARDTAGGDGELSDPHSAMYLTTSYDSCNKSMQLVWTPYVGWTDLVRYEVYYRVDGGSFNTLQGNIHRDTLHLEHPDIEVNHDYCYFTKAIRGDGAYSYSNIACRSVRHPVHPSWINAESASAAGEDRVEVRFAIDPAGEVTSFQLFKAAGPGKPFVADRVFRDVEDSLVHLDPVVSTAKRYQYMLKSLDVCDNPVVESNLCGNIVLEASSAGLEAFLNWSPYLGYEAGVESYRIYRNVSRTGPILAGGVYAPDTTWQDDLSFLSGQEIEDEICYYVEAVERESYTRGERGISRSNQACVSVVPEIFMANALIPNATNPKNSSIMPALTFIPASYLFQVFDRWGSRVFETYAYDEAWDGRINKGKMAPEGVYIYFIRLTTSSGIEVEKKGEITVFYR